MSKLHADQTVLGVDKVRHGFDAGDLVVRPQAGAVGADAAVGLDSRGFDEDQGRSFQRVVAQGADVVGSKGADSRSGFRRGVLAHGGDDGSVAEGSAADLEGGEEGGDFLVGIDGAVCWCTRGDGVARDKVGNARDWLVVG